MTDQLQADVTIYSPNDSGWRDPNRVQFICVHTNQGPEMGSLEGLLHYCADPARGVSYNVVVGGDGRVGRSNDDSYTPWAAGSPANERGLHVCALGYAEQSRTEWLDNPRQLAGLARVIRDWSLRYGIPLLKVSGADLRAGKRGVCGHVDTRDAWHSTDHTDPGPHFPYDVVLRMAAGPEDELTPEEHNMLVEVHREMTYRFQSRVEGSGYRDTLVGYALNTDAKAERTEQRVKALEAQVAALSPGA